MASRHSAARPNRQGETFARAHHGEDDDPSSNKVKFDVRNPSKLAAEAREDDAVLDADVIGLGGATKRGAVNLDGYDSDSDNDTFNQRAQTRKKGKVDILQQLDQYDARDDGAVADTAPAKDNDEGDDDDDMFAASDDEAKEGGDGPDDNEFEKSGKKKKHVQFLDADKIQGQVESSRTGGHVHIDDRHSSDDEEDIDLAIEEEGVDEEVGAGGLKRNAPKLEAFNLREEMEDGRFDQEGNYIRKAGDPDAVHDNWLDGLSKKEIKKAAEAHEKREAEARQQRMDADSVSVADLLRTLILHLERAETPLEALSRLGKSQTKPKKKIPQWKLKKMKGSDGMDMDVDQSQPEDPEQVKIKEAIRAITDAADKLLARDYEEVYDQEREMLVREYRRETGEDWVEPRQASEEQDSKPPPANQSWEFRWTDGRDGAVQGPFDGAMMKAWQEAGYFGEGVEFRSVGSGEEWSRVASFS
jgi:CD2 antigen cytoplasmic tail-binding protein 2